MHKKIIGLILIIISLLIIYFHSQKETNTILNENIELSYYFNESNTINNKQKEHYIAVLEIPKIKLKKGLYNIDSKLNNVDKNIEILHESDMPDIPNGNLILASHSGNSSISYFKNLTKLEINDKIIIYYNNEKYIYKLVNIYEVDKKGSMEIIRNNNKRVLTLITCNKKDKTKQSVFILELDTIE